ncbi:MAG: DUF3343 domain-containing protein [Deltaproteobacteria bacterium]|nr:DUF3343 domain-containing protein [Deltaproteobacteria bacterium]
MKECNEGYLFALFNSTSHVLAAEKILKNRGIPYKLIPVPRTLSSDCGICIRFCREDDRLLNPY